MLHLQKLIFEGPNSQIYYQEKSEFGIPVIIKILKGANPSPQQIKQLNNEYKLTCDLNLAGIRQALAKTQVNGQQALILEYKEGETIKQIFGETKRSLVDFLKIAIQISITLGRLHYNNIFHNSINPSNILFNLQNKNLTFIDFGIASKINHSPPIDAIEQLKGTLAYISPEQTGLLNQVVDYRTDLYSLGITFYEMLTKHPPFEDEDPQELMQAHLTQDVPDMTAINQYIPPVVEKIILKLLAKDADARYQSAFKLQDDLEQGLINLTGASLCPEPLRSSQLYTSLTSTEKKYELEQEIKERKLVEAALAERATELETVAQVSTAVSSILEVEKLLLTVADLINDSFGLTYVHITLLEDDGKTLRWAASAGEIGRQLMAENLRLEIDQNPSIIARTARTRQAMVINDVSQEPNFLEHPLLLDIRSEIAIPMIIGHKVIGVLDVQSNILNRFNDESLRIKTILAAQVAVAIENARLFSQEQRQRQVAESLREVATILSSSLNQETVLTKIMEQLRRVIAYDSSGLFLQEGQDLVFSGGDGFNKTYLGHRVHLSGNTSEIQIYKHKQPFAIADVRVNPYWNIWAEDDPIRSWMGAPLLIDEQAIGVLTADSFQIGAYGPEEVQILQVFANQAATAIKNARLFKSTQVALKQTETLYAASLALGATVNLHEVFELILAELQKVVPYDRANIQEIKEGKYLEIVTAVGFPNLDDVIGLKFNIHTNGIAQTVVSQKIPFIIDDVRTYPEFQDKTIDRSSRAYMSIPILFRNCLLGVVGVDKKEVGFYTKQHARLVVVFATQAAIAIENARLFDEEQQAREAALEAQHVAEAANIAKSTFLANMSHELRTPLNAILGFSQLMQHDPLVSPEQRKNLDIINNSGEHLLELINDVLEMSKIEAKRTTLNPTSFDLHRMLDNLRKMMSIPAERKGLQLLFEYNSDIPRYVKTDERKLRQVLINLLSNAIKFTKTGTITTEITVDKNKKSRNETQKTLHFKVIDTGPGITLDEMDKLFEAFVQTESGQKFQGGTGPGLSISHQFVQLMGGDIRVISPANQTREGVGTIFSFDIQVILTDAADVKTKQFTRRVMGLESNQPIYRILITDDHAESRSLLKQLLKSIGFEVQEASNGQEAIELWSSWQPHLIWMDMRMPVMDGYEATQRIKASTKGATTPIIALTANTFEEEQSKILAAGCDGFLRKPFREADIFEILSNHLRVHYIYDEDKPIKCYGQVEIQSSEAEIKLKLTTLPSTWLDEIHYAASIADSDIALTLIEQIESDHISLAKTLIRLVDDFQFDKLANLTNVAYQDATTE